MIKIDSIPVVDGGWSGWAYIFEPRDQQLTKNDGFPLEDDAPFWYNLAYVLTKERRFYVSVFSITGKRCHHQF